jgi:mannose-6-phosphate isomerase-like protein (cupin superfamily)
MHIKISLACTSLACGLCAIGMSTAQDATPKVQYFASEKLDASMTKPVNGIAYKEFLNRPGSVVSIIRRDQDGQVEVHMTQNDIIMVKSGQGKMTVGGQVKGNHQEEPSEWRGGEISGGSVHPLSAGDVIFIPAGVAHQALVAPPASLTYVIVKTPK